MWVGNGKVTENAGAACRIKRFHQVPPSIKKARRNSKTPHGERGEWCILRGTQQPMIFKKVFERLMSNRTKQVAAAMPPTML